MSYSYFFFFLNDTATTEIYTYCHTLSLHDALPISVGCFCIGTNQVALGSARKQGVPVFNAPYSNTRSVAELVIAEAIMLLRGIPQKNAQCHRGGWAKSASGSYETRDKGIGIVGYGHHGTNGGMLAEHLGIPATLHHPHTTFT